MPKPMLPLSYADPKTALSGIGGFLGDLGNKAIDLPFKLRYGVGADEKSRLAQSGQIPGALPTNQMDTAEEYDDEERRASGYLFGKNWGTGAQPLMDMADQIRILFGDDENRRKIGRDSFQAGIKEHPSYKKSALRGMGVY